MTSTDQIQSTAPVLLLVIALLGAIIGSLSTYCGNSLLETKKRKLDTYSQLQGKNRVLGQIYFSLISERFMSERFDLFRMKCGKASDPLMVYELKRHTELADKYQLELNGYYSDILELLSSIELVFKKSEQLNKKN
jgi:hypothetical protein